MRSFIAIEIPDAVKSSVKDIIRKVEADTRGVRWVPVENMHLTLKFLGEVKEDLISEIDSRLRSIGRRHRNFSVGVSGSGAFPDFKRPNVFWIGLESSDKLRSLFKDIDILMSEIGFERESRGFSPHLTIGRVKDKRGIDNATRELATYKDTFFGTIEVREILLMKSVLKPSGAEYSKVAVIGLDEDNK
jgi:2'-5' RNA ligase